MLSEVSLLLLFYVGACLAPLHVHDPSQIKMLQALDRIQNHLAVMRIGCERVAV